MTDLTKIADPNAIVLVHVQEMLSCVYFAKVQVFLTSVWQSTLLIAGERNSKVQQLM